MLLAPPIFPTMGGLRWHRMTRAPKISQFHHVTSYQGLYNPRTPNMATRKRNEWLDADESEDDIQSNSEEESKGRTTSTRAAKRRKTDSDLEEGLDELEKHNIAGGSGESDNDLDQDPANSDLSHLLALKRALPDSRFNIAAFEDDDDDEENDNDETASQTHLQPKLPKVSKESALSAEKAARRTGVLYLSRIPPFMKPSTLRSLLAPYGALNRIFLTPESATAHASRVRSGGNKKKSYTDGWVEFVSKRDAKNCAALLNGRSVGGKGWYRDDVWVMKYLRGFKWRDLTEQIGNETAERASRMRAEVARSTREQKMFVDGVERGKMLENMENRKYGRQKAEEPEEIEPGLSLVESLHGQPPKLKEARKTHFKQNEVREKIAKAKTVDQPDNVKRVLSKIF